jgi:hypothetical protein
MNVIDSERRCPRCAKRLIVELGSDDLGQPDVEQPCLNCGYVADGPGTQRWNTREIRRRIKLARESLYGPAEPAEGWLIPLVYDAPAGES